MMRIKSHLTPNILQASTEGMNLSPYYSYFVVKYDIKSQVYCQDTIHISTKLKTIFLKEDIFLPMGD